MSSRHLQAVSRVYGPETWELYDLLDESLSPRGPETMLEWTADVLLPQSRILDVGCRDASFLIQLVRQSGASGVGLDPVERLVEQARGAVEEAGLSDRIEIVRGVMQDLPYPDGDFDVVWCRDVLEIVDPLEPALAEAARVLRPGGHMLVYTVFAADRLEAEDVALLAQSLAIVPANLAEKTVERAFAGAGLKVVRMEVIGTEWREHVEEQSQPASRDLLRLARLRRQRAHIVERFGQDIYDHVEANLHWLVYQFLGKLQPTLYELAL